MTAPSSRDDAVPEIRLLPAVRAVTTIVAAVFGCLAWGDESSTAGELPVVEVIGMTPIGESVSVADLPYRVQGLDADAIARDGDVIAAMNRRLSGVTLNAAQGNALMPNLQYRGFTGSPLLGLPQGIAIYQDGVRLNDAFGDTVNWDLLPTQAIETLTVSSGANPAFGLNALGGAVSLRSKTGFSSPGHAFEVEGGSWERRSVAAESGANDGRLAYYATVDHFEEQGWRDFSTSRASHALLRLSHRGARIDGDIGLQWAEADLNGNGTVPIELSREQYAAVFTAPDETRNRLVQGDATLRIPVTRLQSIRLAAFLRQLDGHSFNGDLAEAEPCDEAPSLLCDEVGEFQLEVDGNPVSAAFDATNNLGRRDLRTVGATLEYADRRALFTRDHQLTTGVEWLSGRTNYAAHAEASMLTADRTTLIDVGPRLEEGELAVRTTLDSLALYLVDTLHLTETLTATASLRWNRSRIGLRDRSGDQSELDGTHHFSRLNPALGLVWSPRPEVSTYLNYAESTRAPTPVELSCADEDAPCRLPNDFVSDPPLKQVVAHSWEVGVRGVPGSSFDWQLNAFRTTSVDDIIFQTTGGVLSNEGFFRNVGRTRREGIEASMSTRVQRWIASASVDWLRARFLTGFEEISASHPDADGDGVIDVAAGSDLPSLPRWSSKLALDWEASDRLRLGIDAQFASGQYYRGDEANRLARTAGYWVVNISTDAQISERVSASLSVDNLFDRRYASFGALADASAIFPDMDDPRFIGPGAPRAAWLGLRYAL